MTKNAFSLWDIVLESGYDERKILLFEANKGRSIAQVAIDLVDYYDFSAKKVHAAAFQVARELSLNRQDVVQDLTFLLRGRNDYTIELLKKQTR